MELLVVFSTFPDKDTAQRIARTLVEGKLAACVNLLPGVQSIYFWEGKVETGDEVLALMKTTKEAYPKLEAKIKELHPYEVPEVIAVPVEQAEAVYAEVGAELRKCRAPVNRTVRDVSSPPSALSGCED